jgi:hypothetical protein
MRAAPARGGLPQASSRSHAIFSVSVHQRDTALMGKFSFVDLAGSERASRILAEVSARMHMLARVARFWGGANRSCAAGERAA